MKKSLQFELWQECNSMCKFCYLGKENRTTPCNLKLRTLNDVYEKICDLSIYEEFDNLSFIGGEFFQGQLNTPEIRDTFFKLMTKVSDLMAQGYVKSVWLCATLTIGEQKDLYETLDLFKDLTWDENNSDGLWIITSYDTIGRFHTPKMEENWSNHMLNIHEKYPHIKINTCTILTGDLVDKVVADEFSFDEFGTKYNTHFFFKQPAPGQYGAIAEGDAMVAKQMMQQHLPNFFPTRANFIPFLVKMRDVYPELYTKLFNIKFRADDLYRNFNNEEEHMIHQIRRKNSAVETNIEREMVLNDCGHLLQYAAYIDGNECMICDRDMILNG